MNMIKYVSLCFFLFKHVVLVYGLYETQNEVISVTLHATLNLKQDQFDTLYKNDVKIQIVNVPLKVNKYSVHRDDEYKGVSGEYKKGNMIQLLKLGSEGKTMYVTLYEGDNKIDTKELIKIVPDSSATGLCYEPSESTDNAKIDCVIQLDWNNTLVANEKKKINSSKFARHTAGINATFSCSSVPDDTSIILRQWYTNIQKNESGYSYRVGFKSKAQRLKFTFCPLEVFDDSTVLVCLRPRSGNKITQNITITDTIPSYYKENISKQYYNNNKPVSYDCSNYLQPNIKPVNASLLYENKLQTLPIEGEISLTEKDNGTMIFCLYYKIRYDGPEIEYITRYSSSKTMLIYKEDVKLQSLPVHDENGGPYYIIACGVVFALIIIILVIWCSIKRFRGNKLRKTSSLKPIVNKSGDRVLYANVDVHAPPHSNRKSVVQESPYAEIMHQDRVLYAQLDLPPTPAKINQEESPYAQVIVH